MLQMDLQAMNRPSIIIQVKWGSGVANCTTVTLMPEDMQTCCEKMCLTNKLLLKLKCRYQAYQSCCQAC